MLTERREIKRLIFFFSLVYMASYITRTNLGAVISEVEASTGISRRALSAAVTANFIAYGVGQVISGFLGDRISPKRLVIFGLILTTAMNLLFPLCADATLMTVVWCINGFAQSMLWPPIVKILTVVLSDDDFKDGCTTMSLYASSGTVVIYLIAPLLIFLFSYRSVFVFSAALGAVAILIWARFAPNVENYKKTEKNLENTAPKYNIFTPLLLLILLAITLQGMLRDGVTTWMPSYISDTYSLGSEISILSGVLLPLFSIICMKVTAQIYKKRIRNPLTLAGIIFLLGAVAALGLALLGGRVAILSVLLSALLTGSMYGVNLMLISMVPGFFKGYRNLGLITGVLNFATYVGSAVSTYGIALISEGYGWDTTITIWFGIAALGTALCLILARPFSNKFIKKV
ncbi:MAG: MFS transporter [Clostridia bacterium]|nr:MFS transporter [Clostridia bacterium]